MRASPNRLNTLEKVLILALAALTACAPNDAGVPVDDASVQADAGADAGDGILTADFGKFDAAPVQEAPKKIPGTLTLQPQKKPGDPLAMSYGFNDRSTTVSVTAEVTADQVTATLQDDHGTKATLVLNSRKDAAFSVGGQTLSGKGALTADQQAALKLFGQSDLALGAALAALELGCADNQPENDAQRAAIVAPLQFLMKYDAQFPGIVDLLGAVKCQYLAPAEEPTPTVLPQGDGQIEVAKTDDNGKGIRVTKDDLVPNVYGYWPLDGEGAVDRLQPFAHDTRPCGAQCPGTCGPDCPTNNCTSTFAWYCDKDAAGQNTGTKRVWRRYSCGSHAGCRAHDSCYDTCNATNGCGSWGATTCRRGCDVQCLADYCPWCGTISFGLCGPATCKCTSWMNGNGPYDATLTYWHDIGVVQNDVNGCPPPAPKCANDAACDDGNQCTVDKCNPKVGCSNVAKLDGTFCDDGKKCTDPDYCQFGSCKGKDKYCNDFNACTTDTCDSATGQCKFTPVTDGTSCDDGQKCTENDACKGGNCQGSAKNCDDGDPCTFDGCEAASGTCTHTPAPDGTPCSDGNLCTTGDICKSGICQPGGVPGCDDGQMCTTDACDPATGQCSHSGIANCCASDAACNDGNSCTDDACNLATGVCSHANNTAPCNDGNACTFSDMCASGSCVAGTPNTCNDGDICTTDQCDPVSGQCGHGVVINCCTTNAQCNDANWCTDDTCISNNCANIPNTIGCNDGNTCTVGDTCSGGACSPGTPMTCADTNECTTDSCNPASGCVFTVAPNGNPCSSGSCQGGVCTSTPGDGFSTDSGSFDAGSYDTSSADVDVCGDGYCTGSENASNCASDCGGMDAISYDNGGTDAMSYDVPDADVCGDGYCTGSENANNCASDCGGADVILYDNGGTDAMSYDVPDADVCGDGYCTGSENASNCASDCGGADVGFMDTYDAGSSDAFVYDVAYCGDGYCTSGETVYNCSADCGLPPGSDATTTVD